MSDSIFPGSFVEGWPLVFLHIPKCSGTSFENYLATCSHFKGRCSCFTGISPDGLGESFPEFVNRNASTPFIYGHIGYILYERFFPHALILTFLRDPVQRTISHYKSWHDPQNFHEKDHHYIKATKEMKDAMEFSQKATLEEFVKTDNPIIKTGALHNIQTTMLSSCSNVSLDVQLESAKVNLNKCIFFGLTEYFNESITVFRSLFSDAPDYAMQSFQENRSRIELNNISSKTLETIKEQVVHDASLYEYAKNLFQNRNHPQFAREKSYSLFDMLPENNPTVPREGLKEVINDLLKREEHLRQEYQILLEHVGNLTDLYESIVQSKGWRLIETLRSAKRWMHKQ